MLDFLPIPEVIRPQIDAYWADFLGCRRTLLYPAQSVTLRAENSPGLLGLQTERHWLLALHPDVTVDAADGLVEEVLPLLDPMCTVAMPGWQHALQHQLRLRAFADIYGPACVLYCSEVNRHPINALTIQRLTEQDQPRIQQDVQQFQQDMDADMGAVAWQLDQPQLWPRICGIFQDDRLVAAGAVRCWGDTIGEIFVDTLPCYRNRGYAKALASHLTDWVLRETTWLPQYDAEIHNLPSLRVAHAVGFAYYGMLLMGNLTAQPAEQ